MIAKLDGVPFYGSYDLLKYNVCLSKDPDYQNLTEKLNAIA